MTGNKKGFMMTFLVLILFLLMLAEVLTFVTLNSTYNQISQNLQVSSSTNNYAQELQSSSTSFAQSSLSRALQTLYLYESNPSLRKSNFITSFNATMVSLIKNSTITNVTANSATANTIKSDMGSISFLYYNASVVKLLGASTSNVIINETGVRVFQSSPFTLSLSYMENVHVNTTYGAFQYNIPVSSTISLNNTPNLLAAQEGVSKYVQFTTANLTSIIGNSYASSGNTIGFQYGLTFNVPSGVTCSQLSTLATSANVNAAPYNRTIILVTADASEITNSICNHANNFGGLVTTAITNAPSTPYLVYPSGSSVINLLQTGQSVLLYGPGLDVLNISRLRTVAANGYYMASPYAMSYSDIASDSVLHQSQNGLFTLSNYDTQVGSFNGQNGYINIPNQNYFNLPSGSSLGVWFDTNTISSTFQDIVSTYTPGWTLYLYPNELYFYNGSANIMHSAVLQANTWYYAMITNNGNNWVMYINGVQVATGSGGTITSTNPLRIGGRSSGASFSGSIANLQVYNTSLSAQQVQTLYQRGISGLPIANSGLVGWWTLNGNSTDYSGFNNNGVSTGVIYTLPANYVRDSIMINNYTTGLQPIPGLLLCNDNSDCNNPAFPHLYTGMSPLITNSSALQVAKFNTAGTTCTGSGCTGPSSIAVSSAGIAGTNNAYTIAMWIKPNGYPCFSGQPDDYATLLGISGFTNFVLFGNSNSCATSFTYMMAHRCSSADTFVALPAPVVVGAWAFVAVSVSNPNYNFFVDGANAAVQNSNTYSTTSSATFGESKGCFDAPFNGSIADVQIYNTALSTAQISQLYNEGVNGAPVNTANIVGWWPLNGNANDYSGNNNNGANVNVGYIQMSSGGYLPGNSRPNNYASELQALGLENN